jgi:glycerophosphoryl diester phosphodiesterase
MRPMPGLDWLTARPVAHRALHDAGRGIIENSETAIRAAIAGGYPIEVDIQRTADDRAVVFHDYGLGRLTEVAGPVMAHTQAKLEKLSLTGTNDTIISLDTLLEIVAGQVPLIIEIKSPEDGNPALAHRIAERAGSYRGPLAAMSFDPLLVETLRKAIPFLPRGIISYAYADQHASLLPKNVRFRRRHLLDIKSASPHFIAYDCRALPAPAAMFTRHVLGMPLLSWTVRSADEQKRIAKYADQIIFEGFQPA